MSRLIFPLAVYFFYTVTALAAGGGGEGDHGVPRVVLYQAINVSILVGLLVYLLKDKVKDAFKARGTTYQEAVQSAKRAMEEAQERQTEIQKKLEALSSTEKETLEKAQTDSVKLKEKLISEGIHQAEHILKEAERTKKFETEKAILTLRLETLEKAVGQAEEDIGGKINESDLKSLNKEFVENIGVVQ